eukprot:scaffold905_cov363-Pavlova_lutheri.AAC.19
MGRSRTGILPFSPSLSIGFKPRHSRSIPIEARNPRRKPDTPYDAVGGSTQGQGLDQKERKQDPSSFVLMDTRSVPVLLPGPTRANRPSDPPDCPAHEEGSNNRAELARETSRKDQGKGCGSPWADLQSMNVNKCSNEPKRTDATSRRNGWDAPKAHLHGQKRSPWTNIASDTIGSNLE